MENTQSIQVLVQSGAIGLCFYLIYINRKAYNGQFKIMLDVITKNTEVNDKLSGKIDELIRRRR